MSKFKIIDIDAIEILDSRGNPTIETKVTLKGGAVGVGKVPSGASTGSFEAVELRDKDASRYLGKGVLNALINVNTVIKPKLIGLKSNNQQLIDKILIELDGTPNKSKLGANAILSVSLAVAHATANAMNIPLYEYLSNGNPPLLPLPMCNILNGGAHASNNVDIQEFMIMPVGAKNFTEGIRWCAEVFHNLSKILKSKNMSTSVGDEGGFAPNLKNEVEVFDIISLAIKQAGYKLGEDIVFAVDAAASEWFVEKNKYIMPKSKREFTTDELIEFWVNLSKQYPIISLEDPLGEDDWAAWKKLTKKVGSSVQIVGDDLYVTNTERLNKGISQKSTNSILIKVNQIGTLSETIDAIKLAQDNGFTTVISHRSGETEDTTIADLAVALSCTQIKTGSTSRSDRVAKYNRLIRIENDLKEKAVFAGKNAFYNITKK